MIMPTFAQELAERLIKSDQYSSLFAGLQAMGVIETLYLKPAYAAMSADDIAKLLYCAEVFVQTDEDNYHKQAQEIAIHTLLISRRENDSSLRERALALLNELGNFPGLSFVEQHLVQSVPSLLSLINRRVSEALNTVAIGDKPVALTAYQKRVWNCLPQTRASVISAPTSAGKSFLVIEHMCRLAEGAGKLIAAYVTPTRALLSEVHQKVQLRLKESTEVRVSSIPTFEEEHHNQSHIFVLTQERLSTLLSIAPNDFKFDLLVVDESQNISDSSRGMILQDCLERIAERSRQTQVILLAPGVIGMPEVAKSFGIADLVSISTQLSPVQQNRIVLTKVHRKPKEVSISVIGAQGKRIELGTVELSRSLNAVQSRLALIALEFGGDGGSLLYETGASEAEKAASCLVELLKARGVQPRSGPLEELSAFIKEHVHAEYQLVEMVRYGVAYHYGKMPSLLREAIEAAFKREEDGIQFLVCTTTLAQGVNLPARNVFIDTPTYGQGNSLNPALLWNFAGRAGRLSQDVVGNVYLVDYDKWPTKPMDNFVPYTVKSATEFALQTHGERIAAALKEGVLPKIARSDPDAGLIRSGAGLLIAHAARQDIQSYLSHILAGTEPYEVEKLIDATISAYRMVDLPDHVLAENWTIDAFGLKRLYDNLIATIGDGEIAKLIPMNPKDAPYGFYEALFGRIVEQVNGVKWEFGALAGRLAVDWMKGIPYPAMLGSWVARQRRREARNAAQAEREEKVLSAPKTIDALIRNAFDLIEDTVRFQFVQLGRAYRDLLLHALRQTGNSEVVPNVFDFAMALELGISSKAGTVYVELGLSRIAASALDLLAPKDGPFSANDARELLWKLDIGATTLSPIIVAELNRLGLVNIPAEL